MRLPGRSGCAPLRAMPSTRTWPASISCFACERVPIPGTVARKRSSRTPAPAAGTTTASRPAPTARSAAAGLRGEHALCVRHVGGDRRPERVGAVEAPLATQTFDHLHGKPAAIEVAREVEEMHLDRVAAPSEGGPYADVHDARAPRPIDLRRDRVHAVGGEEEAAGKVQVRGREAERPPATIADHHSPAERVRATEQAAGTAHVAGLDERAQPRAAHPL